MTEDFSLSSYFGCLLKSHTDLRTLVVPSCEIVSKAGIGWINITYGVGMENLSEILQSLTTRTHSYLTFFTRKVFGKYKI
jgi:hypothetical protein